MFICSRLSIKLERKTHLTTVDNPSRWPAWNETDFHIPKSQANFQFASAHLSKPECLRGKRCARSICRVQNNCKLGTRKCPTSVRSRQLGLGKNELRLGKIRWRVIQLGIPRWKLGHCSRAPTKVLIWPRFFPYFPVAKHTLVINPYLSKLLTRQRKMTWN